MAERKDLFDEFPAVSNKEWEAAIEKSLKGKERDSINWEGELHLQPYYRINNFPKTQPGQFPYRRGIDHTGNSWDINEKIVVSDPKQANKKALKSLMNGATALTFHIEDDSVDLMELINQIKLQYIGLNFSGNNNPTKTIDQLISFVKSEQLDEKTVKGCLGYSPITDFAINKKWINSQKDQLDFAVELANKTIEHLPNYRCINVGGNAYGNAGATITQQLAYTIAEGVEYLNHLTEKNVPIDEASAKLQFTISVGSSFFMEIAKIRALRILWANVVKAYKPEHNCSTACFIQAETSLINKSKIDKHNNILRTTTEAMSAILGGVNSLSVLPFDYAIGQPSNFSKRVARNIQNLLKDETFLDKVADPAGGSYYIEEITQQLCTNAWKLFQEVDSKGGLISVIEKGEIEEEISKQYNKVLSKIANGEKTIIGVNKYQLEKKEPTPYGRKDTVAGLSPKRYAEKFEEN